MKNRKLLYIYTNKMDIIQRIETSAIIVDENFNEYLIPENQSEEFLALKEDWALSYDAKPAILLLLEHDKYKPKKVVYVYFDKKTFIPKNISNTTLNEYADDETVAYGIVEITSLVDDFITNKKDISHYKAEQNGKLLDFIERKIHQDISFEEHDLLEHNKLSFKTKEKEKEIELYYDRKKKELVVQCIDDLPITSILLHFTKKHDRTILYQSAKVKLNNGIGIIQDIELPYNQFDIYSPLNEDYKFLFNAGGRKLLYVYTDKMNVIQNIETFTVDEYRKNFNEILIPIEHSKELIVLKEKWELTDSSKPATALLLEDSNYKPINVAYVYFDKTSFTPKNISPVLLEEYDKTLSNGIVEITPLIDDFIAGNKNMSQYDLKQNNMFLSFVKQTVQQNITLLKNNQLDFVKKEREIELEYNQNKKELSVRCIDDLPITSILLHFTKKHDRTVLYKSIEVELKNGIGLVKGIKLPNKQIDVYSPLNEQYKFLFNSARKLLYIYTDKMNVIQKIEEFSIKENLDGLIEYLIPEDQSKEFLKLKKAWDLTSGYKPTTALLLKDGKYKPKKVTYVYFYKKSLTPKSISPVLLEEYDNDETLTCGITEITSLINDFMIGNKNMSQYDLKQNNMFLTFVERKLHQAITIKEINLLKKYKLIFVIKKEEIELQYNRKKKELSVRCIDDLPITSILLHFTKKHDRTVLYKSVKIELKKGIGFIKDIKLPKNFDIYSLFNKEYKFLYKEKNKISICFENEKRKLLYVYTNEMNIIQNIETFAVNGDFNETLIPEEQGKEILALKEEWNVNCGYNPATALLMKDDNYKPKRIVYVYFDKISFTPKSISPVLLEEYDNDETLTCGIIEITTLINDFVAGKKNMARYSIEQDNMFLTFVERKLPQAITVKEINLLKKYKLIFVIEKEEIELQYNRKKKELLVRRLYDHLPITSVILHFTKKYDRTILYQSIEVEIKNGYGVIKNIKLPKNFDIYSPFNEEYKFLYKEKNGKRKSYKNINK